MILRLYPACLPLVSDSGCPGPHDSALVSPFSPTLVTSHRLSPTVSKYAAGALGRMSLRLSPVLHLSPSCLPLPGSALDRLSPSWLPGSPLSKKGVDALDLLILDYLPLVSQCAVGGLGRMTRAAGALGPMMLHLPLTCLPVCCGCSELHGSTLAPHLSRACLRLSCCMRWVLWAA